MKHVLSTLLLAAAAFAPAAAQMMTNPPAMSADRINRAHSGEALTFVMRIDTRDRRDLRAHVLEHLDGMSYRATTDAIDVYVPDDLPIVMGTRDDLKAGTVVYVYAVKTHAGAADASKIVVLTPYVSVR